eukprot:5771848-Pyramimonas_sp.AAC.1
MRTATCAHRVPEFGSIGTVGQRRYRRVGRDHRHNGGHESKGRQCHGLLGHGYVPRTCQDLVLAYPARRQQDLARPPQIL